MEACESKSKATFKILYLMPGNLRTQPGNMWKNHGILSLRKSGNPTARMVQSSKRMLHFFVSEVLNKGVTFLGKWPFVSHRILMLPS